MNGSGLPAGGLTLGLAFRLTRTEGDCAARSCAPAGLIPSPRARWRGQSHRCQRDLPRGRRSSALEPDANPRDRYRRRPQSGACAAVHASPSRAARRCAPASPGVVGSGGDVTDDSRTARDLGLWPRRSRPARTAPALAGAARDPAEHPGALGTRFARHGRADCASAEGRCRGRSGADPRGHSRTTHKPGAPRPSWRFQRNSAHGAFSSRSSPSCCSSSCRPASACSVDAARRRRHEPGA